MYIYIYMYIERERCICIQYTPLKIKNPLESNPVKSGFLARELTASGFLPQYILGTPSAGAIRLYLWLSIYIYIYILGYLY